MCPAIRRAAHHCRCVEHLVLHPCSLHTRHPSSLHPTRLHPSLHPSALHSCRSAYRLLTGKRHRPITARADSLPWELTNRNGWTTPRECAVRIRRCKGALPPSVVHLRLCNGTTSRAPARVRPQRCPSASRPACKQDPADLPPGCPWTAVDGAGLSRASDAVDGLLSISSLPLGAQRKGVDLDATYPIGSICCMRWTATMIGGGMAGRVDQRSRKSLFFFFFCGGRVCGEGAWSSRWSPSRAHNRHSAPTSP
jgi:hypothetical protein